MANPAANQSAALRWIEIYLRQVVDLWVSHHSSLLHLLPQLFRIHVAPRPLQMFPFKKQRQVVRIASRAENEAGPLTGGCDENQAQHQKPPACFGSQQPRDVGALGSWQTPDSTLQGRGRRRKHLQHDQVQNVPKWENFKEPEKSGRLASR